MSDFLALLERLSGLGANTLVIALLALAVAVVVVRRWQATLPLLVILYCALTLVLTLSLQAGVALLHGAAGIVACLILSVAAQRAGVTGPAFAPSSIQHGRRWSLRRLSTPLLLRTSGVIFVVLIVLGIMQRFPSFGSSRTLDAATLTLLALGLLMLATTRDALSHAQGLLLMLAGITVGASALDASASIGTLLAFTTVLLGFVCAYLTLADSNAIVEENQRT